jgi:hypothetical protein
MGGRKQERRKRRSRQLVAGTAKYQVQGTSGIISKAHGVAAVEFSNKNLPGLSRRRRGRSAVFSFILFILLFNVTSLIFAMVSLRCSTGRYDPADR